MVLQAVALVLALVSPPALGVDNGVGLQPPMGWRNWNSMHGNVNQAKMELAMEKMAEQKRAVIGLDGPRSYVDLGYNRVGLDDGWQKCGAGVNGSFHDESGAPIVDGSKFPSMKSMVTYGTVRGIRVGWYGNNCMCAEKNLLTDPAFLDKALLGTVAAHVKFNFTGIKLDGCGPHLNLTRWAEALNASDHATLIEDCHWGNAVPLGPSGGGLAVGPKDDDFCKGLATPSECPYNLYRSSGDIINTFERVYANVHSLTKFLDPEIPLSKPGAWAFPDGLELGRMQSSGAYAAAEERTMFGWYAITSSPLILGHNVSDDATNDAVWDIVSNTEAIAVNQAWAGHPGRLVKTWAPPASAPAPVWPLGRALYNVTCDAADATQLGWSFDSATSALIAPGGNKSKPLCVDTQRSDNNQLWSAPCKPHPSHGIPQQFAWVGEPDKDGFAALEAMQQKKNIAVPGAQNSVGFARGGMQAGGAMFRVGHGGGSQLEVRVADKHGVNGPVWCIATRALNPVHDATRTYELWSKPLGGGRVAALLVNHGPSTDWVSFDPFVDLADGLDGAKEARVRDVWAHADVEEVLRPGAGYGAELAPHASALVVVTKVASGDTEEVLV